MKGVFLLLPFCLAGIALRAQEDTLYYPSDSLKAIGQVKDGKKTGPWQLFYWNGQRQSSGEYYNNQPIGVWTNWYKDGKLWAIASYDSSGLRHGPLMEYNYRVPETIQTNWLHGVPHGHAVWRHLEGHFIITGEYVLGERSGQWFWFWPSGVVQASGVMKDDTFHGTWTYYHENGSVDSRGRFAKGLKTGKWQFFYDSGNRRMTGKYLEDKEHGKWLRYNSSGRLIEELQYDRGVLR